MNDDEKREFEQLKRDLEDLKRNIDNPHIELDTDLFGLFQTVSVAPTTVPKIAYDQIQIYKNGATLRLYVYDAANQGWRYTALT